MKHEEGTIDGAGGTSIYWQSWLPKGTPIASIVIAHGLGEHSGRYARAAEFLTSKGYVVYAIDHRGHGKSEGKRALVDNFDYAVADMDKLVEIVRARHSDRKLFLLGHSMGGALSLSYALSRQKKLDGLLLSGPAVSLDGISRVTLVISKILSIFFPGLGLFSVDPSVVSRDAAEAEAYDADPLNFHGKVPARTLGEIIKFVGALPDQLKTIKLPLLIMHGTDDKLAGIAGSEMVLKMVKSKDKTLKRYEGLYHEIFNEFPKDRERVFADMGDWLGARAS